MAELVQANWVLLVIALVIGILIAWWVFAANRKTRVEIEEREDDAGPAKRNQALIDAPPASTPMSSAANSQQVAAARASADAEAGPEIVPTTDTAAAPADTVADPGPGAAELTQIKGLGPKLQAQLADMGITSLSQIAGWDDAEIDRIDAQLGRFKGRIRRDDWPAQARLLLAGDLAAYERRFGAT